MKTGASLFGVIVIGVLLNILGIKLNGVLGLPFYLDNVGTILSAMVGGYIPCITVYHLPINCAALRYRISCFRSYSLPFGAVSSADC